MGRSQTAEVPDRQPQVPLGLGVRMRKAVDVKPALQALRFANIDRGRLLALTGDTDAAANALWREHLLQPDDPASYWALWEFHARYPYRRTIVAHDEGVRTLDLAPEWSEDQAVASNLAALPWDGLQAIEDDGGAVFTAATAKALHALLGRPVESLHPDDAPTLARDLLAAVDAG